MTKLKIRKAGHTLRIPGLPECRTPVEIDITHIKIFTVLSYLKNNGIEEFEILSDLKEEYEEKREVHTVQSIKKKTTNNKDLGKRITKLEKRLEEQCKPQKIRNESKKEEQIINKLDKIEKMFSNINFGIPSDENFKLKKKEPEIEDIASFIPEIDTGGMKLSTSDSSKKTIKKDSDSIDESADMLANLIKKK